MITCVRKRPVQPNEGQVLIEMVIGTLSIAVILMGLLTAIVAQNRHAARLACDTRVRLLLEGEMERMRGLGASQFHPCEDEPLEPFLGVPDALRDTRFYKTVVLDGEGRLARVRLRAQFGSKEREGRSVVLEGALYLEED